MTHLKLRKCFHLGQHKRNTWIKNNTIWKMLLNRNYYNVQSKRCIYWKTPTLIWHGSPLWPVKEVYIYSLWLGLYSIFKSWKNAKSNFVQETARNGAVVSWFKLKFFGVVNLHLREAFCYVAVYSYYKLWIVTTNLLLTKDKRMK